jgi:hypothetical protein
MFEIRTHRSISAGSTFVANINDTDVVIEWKDDALLADGDPRQILHTWLETDSRVFACAGSPESPDEPSDVCEYCIPPTQAILTHHGLNPVAVKGFHLSEDGKTAIPCRLAGIKANPPVNSIWHNRYANTPAAKI